MFFICKTMVCDEEIETGLNIDKKQFPLVATADVCIAICDEVAVLYICISIWVVAVTPSIAAPAKISHVPAVKEIEAPVMLTKVLELVVKLPDGNTEAFKTSPTYPAGTVVPSPADCNNCLFAMNPFP